MLDILDRGWRVCGFRRICLWTTSALLDILNRVRRAEAFWCADLWTTSHSAYIFPYSVGGIVSLIHFEWQPVPDRPTCKR